MCPESSILAGKIKCSDDLCPNSHMGSVCPGKEKMTADSFELPTKFFQKPGLAVLLKVNYSFLAFFAGLAEPLTDHLGNNYLAICTVKLTINLKKICW